MNFTLTKEQELVRQMVREFAVNEVKPIAAEIDVTERFPMENVKKMARDRNDGNSISLLNLVELVVMYYLISYC